ncbi:MAG: tetratricopeptide repeat protein, partial [bacterium]
TDCASMNDEELVRVLTLDKEDFTEGSLQLVTREMARRKFDLAEFINRVQISLNDGEPESCTIDQALAKIRQEISWGEGWTVANCLEEGIIILKEVKFWTIHFFVKGECLQSFTVKTREKLEAFAEQFLRLAGDSYTVDYQYHLDECETFLESSSLGYVAKISTLLADAEVPHTLRTADRFYFDAISGAKQTAGLLYLLVPREYKEAVDAVASAIENKIQSLREEIAALAAKDEHDPQLLELYNQLSQLVDGDPAVSYGRGVLHFERGRNEEAAEAFIELAHTCMGSQTQLPTGDFEAYWQASENHLERLSAVLPENLGVLHCLANMAMFDKNDEKAKARYEKILAVAPADSIAHLNLGYLYYDDRHYHARAARHFRSYLDSQPDAEDRTAIEEILANL